MYFFKIIGILITNEAVRMNNVNTTLIFTRMQVKKIKNSYLWEMELIITYCLQQSFFLGECISTT